MFKNAQYRKPKSRIFIKSYIFHDSELWEGQEAGPHNLKKGDVYYFSTKKILRIFLPCLKLPE